MVKRTNHEAPQYKALSSLRYLLPQHPVMTYPICYSLIIYNVTKCKSFPYQVMKTKREDGVLGPHPTLTFGKTRTAELSILRAGRTLPPRKFLGTHLRQGLSGLQRYWLRTEGIGHFKISKDSTGIEPGTSRLVAQCLNQLRCSYQSLENRSS